MKWNKEAVQSRVETPLGPMRLCATATGLTGAWFHDQRHSPDAVWFTLWPTCSQHPILAEAERQLTAYFAGKRRGFDLPLDLSGGTPFQREVWQTLLAIPNGTTCNYGEVAERIGRPSAVRAVGAAVGRNPVSIIVPCHRVLGANGSLTGYAGGLHRKVRLLELERDAS